MIFIRPYINSEQQVYFLRKHYQSSKTLRWISGTTLWKTQHVISESLWNRMGHTWRAQNERPSTLRSIKIVLYHLANASTPLFKSYGFCRNFKWRYLINQYTYLKLCILHGKVFCRCCKKLLKCIHHAEQYDYIAISVSVLPLLATKPLYA